MKYILIFVFFFSVKTYGQIDLSALDTKTIIKLYPKLLEVLPEKALGIPSMWPLSEAKYVSISRGMGLKRDPFKGCMKYHGGIDIAVNNSYVLASANGIVVDVGYNRGGYGQYIIINHGHGFESLYGHLSSIFVIKGQKVNIAEAIGRSGSTGKSTGEHLHYEVRRFGFKENPANFLLLLYNNANLFASKQIK